MTVRSAELLGIEMERGEIKEDYFADIIAVRKNPIDDIESIKDVHFVMKEGEIIRNDND
jgi:imidazolonepropionase-like amidohydrolase